MKAPHCNKIFLDRRNIQIYNVAGAKLFIFLHISYVREFKTARKYETFVREFKLVRIIKRQKIKYAHKVDFTGFPVGNAFSHGFVSFRPSFMYLNTELFKPVIKLVSFL